MHDVAIGHDIVLALNAQLAGGLGALLAAELDVVVIANDLGLNKAALKVGVDDTGSLRSGRTLTHRPGLDLHLASRKERLQAKQLVGCLREHVQTGLLQAQALQVVGRILGIELGKLGLDLGADGQWLDTIDGRQVVVEHILVHVGHIQDGLHGEQEQALGSGALLVGHLHRRSALALVEPGKQTLGDLELGHELLVALGLLLELGQLLLERTHVGQDELGHDGIGIAGRIDELARAAHFTHDVGILKVAHDLADGVGLADVCQELVAQALALVGALHQTCDVDELDRSRHDAARVNDVGELLQAAIGHINDTHVGVDRGKRVVGGKAGLFGKRGEQRRLAHVGQAHDTDGKGHDSSFWYKHFKLHKYSAAAASGRTRTPRRHE